MGGWRAEATRSLLLEDNLYLTAHIHTEITQSRAKKPLHCDSAQQFRYFCSTSEPQGLSMKFTVGILMTGYKCNTSYMLRTTVARYGVYVDSSIDQKSDG